MQALSQQVQAIRLPERPAADRAVLRAIRGHLAEQVECLRQQQQATLAGSLSQPANFKQDSNQTSRAETAAMR